MKLIINADDFGKAEGINKAIIELAGSGTISSTTVMVNMPFASHANELVNIKGLGIGLHLNLTEGKSVSDPFKIPSLINKTDGNFYPHPEFVKRVRFRLVSKRDVLQEITAQFNVLKGLIGDHLDHIDTHQNIHKEFFIANVLIEFGKANSGLGIRSPYRYFISPTGINFRITNYVPGQNAIKSMKSKLTNCYLKLIAQKLSGYFKTPVGEVHFETFKKVDYLNWMIDSYNLPLTDAIFEVPCHPATTTKGIKCSKLLEKRIMEYEIMLSDDFMNALKKFSLLTFKDL